MTSVLLQKTPYGSFGSQPGGTLAKYQGKDQSPSVMDKEELPLTAEELARSLAERDAFKGAGLPTLDLGPLGEFGISDFVTPGGLAKVGAGLGKLLGVGIIAGGRASARDLGIVPIVNHIEELAKSGVSQHKIAQVSSELLAGQRNPGGAMSMFIGPDGKSRVVLANKDAQLLNPSVPKFITKIKRKTPVPEIPLMKGDGSLSIPDAGVQVSDVLLHPSLYNISDKAKNLRLEYNPYTELFNPGGLGIDKDATTILAGSFVQTPRKMSRDPIGGILEGLLHEANHAVQIEQGLRGGTSDSIDMLRKALTEAKEKGSFKSPERLKAYETILDRMDRPEFKTKTGTINERGQAILEKMYQSNYGEWEARAGSEYSDTTFPMMHERGKTW